MPKRANWNKDFGDLRDEVTSVEPELQIGSGEPTVGATLTTISGGESGRVFYVGESGGVLGRGDEADFVFSDTTISRAHATLRMHGGDYYISDLGSSNGTFVDGVRVKKRVKMPASCRLRVGRETVLQFTALDEIGREREYQRMLVEERLRWEKERSRELEQQANELRLANEDLAQFAFAVSHDLQEPLRMVTSYLQLLEERYPSAEGEEAGQYLDFALDGAKRMKVLLDDLLAYCRLGRGESSLDAVDLAGVVDQVTADLGVAIRESDATVTRDLLPIVAGNRTQLVQLIQNLVSNGIKFQRGVPPEVHVGIRGEGEEWVFYVRDNGIGIRAEDQERIFQIFQRLHSRDDYPGTGIGLTLAKKIVERHGGRIWLESTLDEGTTFYFTIPTTDGALADMTQTVF